MMRRERGTGGGALAALRVTDSYVSCGLKNMQVAGYNHQIRCAVF
jgi:hypothetical protein